MTGLTRSSRACRRSHPAQSEGVDLRNPRRVVRALEIAELAGDLPRPAALGYPGPSTWIGLTVEPAIHEDRIARRAQAQFDGGLIDEARTLRERFAPTLAGLLGDRLPRGVGRPRRGADTPPRRSSSTPDATSPSPSASEPGSAPSRTSPGCRVDDDPARDPPPSTSPERAVEAAEPDASPPVT